MIYDVRTWLASAEAELHNITNPHCFVIKEATNGDVVLKYKTGQGIRHGSQVM